MLAVLLIAIIFIIYLMRKRLVIIERSDGSGFTHAEAVLKLAELKAAAADPKAVTADTAGEAGATLAKVGGWVAAPGETGGLGYLAPGGAQPVPDDGGKHAIFAMMVFPPWRVRDDNVKLVM